jgi:hypothetical protein
MFTNKNRQKPIKTKLKRNEEDGFVKVKQQQKKDKGVWRLLRQEEKDYVI